ncbi:MCE family protein [Nocardia sp. ET3-3]|uniref:MCE family protein n=1 Tax=Nocardia terrae TaxID=2675851 RepID=A0A7K1US83_9NOCA|nr:MlaD family protein [Nocardia terrae]MVU77212.1 MCE family protein [Nocardia terrae]
MKKALCATTAAVALLLPTGCAFDPASIPVPGASVSGPTYAVHIEFANALNLPSQAKVVANGAKIGSLRTVRVIDPTSERPGRIDAVVDIQRAVRLPSATTAQLRQDTLLGDVFIGLTTPAGDFADPIPAGGTIPLAQTKPALQVEDLLAGLSGFVGGGALHQVEDIIDQANAALPADSRDTARIFDRIGGNVEDVSDHLAVLDEFLDAFQNDLDAVRGNPRELDALLSQQGAHDIPADVQALVNTLGIVGSLGDIGQALVPLAPLLRAGDATAKAFVPMLLANNPLDLSAPSNLNRLVALVDDRLVPFVEKGPKVNITGVTTGAGDAVSAEDRIDGIVRALRMIGVVR